MRRLLSVFILVAWCALPISGGDEARVRFVVTAPAEPSTKTLRVVGDQPALGAWQIERGLVLERIAGTSPPSYSGRVTLPRGATVEFKVVRESWESVEKSDDGSERPNRRALIERDEELRLTVARWADGRPADGRPDPRAPKSSACEHVKLLGSFGEKSLGRARPVWFHLPPGYQKSRRYPVLIMLDGQNVFDRANAAFGEEWGADESQDRLLAAGAIEPFIILAVGNSPARIAEYTPDADSEYGGGQLEKLDEMLTKEIMPALAARHPIQEGARARAICGSSLGGLAAFHLALRHPERYGLAAAISPSFWWNARGTLRGLQSIESLTKARKLWLCMGTREGDGTAPVTDLRAVAARLKELGYGAAELRVEVIPDARHSEPDWRARLPRVFEFLFPAPH